MRKIIMTLCLLFVCNLLAEQKANQIELMEFLYKDLKEVMSTVKTMKIENRKTLNLIKKTNNDFITSVRKRLNEFDAKLESNEKGLTSKLKLFENSLESNKESTQKNISSLKESLENDIKLSGTSFRNSLALLKNSLQDDIKINGISAQKNISSLRELGTDNIKSISGITKQLLDVKNKSAIKFKKIDNAIKTTTATKSSEDRLIKEDMERLKAVARNLMLQNKSLSEKKSIKKLPMLKDKKLNQEIITTSSSQKSGSFERDIISNFVNKD